MRGDADEGARRWRCGTAFATSAHGDKIGMSDGAWHGADGSGIDAACGKENRPSLFPPYISSDECSVNQTLRDYEPILN